MRKNLPDQFSGPLAYNTVHTRGHTLALAKGYANVERAVWKLLSSLPLSFSFSTLSSFVRLLVFLYPPSSSLPFNPPPTSPPNLWSFHKSHARQVGSLLRNGFPDFFAAIKGTPGVRVGNGQRDFHHENRVRRFAGHARSTASRL